MNIIVTDPAFIDARTNLAFDCVIKDIQINERGFDIEVKVKLKDINGEYLEEYSYRETVELKQANAQNAYNNAITQCVNKVVNKFTP